MCASNLGFSDKAELSKFMPTIHIGDHADNLCENEFLAARFSTASRCERYFRHLKFWFEKWRLVPYMGSNFQNSAQNFSRTEYRREYQRCMRIRDSE
ncbi:hypothetical protein J2S49_000711 [Arcanobacterium wilhelmae]|uniref:Uncharacterized protein n=1 Tax=Arcanobacterium wilhelmae TaxID=1803177 RepID=A0ABT9NAA6_9ACTO|nr:hypothetical protein [Arcanobacterium wilhelmae]